MTTDVIRDLVYEHNRRVAHAVAVAMGQAALRDKGGVRITYSLGQTSVRYDPDAPYLTIVHEKAEFSEGGA